jgi:hypothetical protein
MSNDDRISLANFISMIERNESSKPDADRAL